MGESIKKAKYAVQKADTLVRRGADSVIVATALEPAENGRKRFRAGSIGDFPEGSHRVVDLGGRQLGVFHIKGEMYALPNICPHMTGPVCESNIITGSLKSDESTHWKPEWIHDGEVIICPWHGLEFHVPSGRCLSNAHIRMRRYEVTVEGNDVVVQL